MKNFLRRSGVLLLLVIAASGLVLLRIVGTTIALGQSSPAMTTLIRIGEFLLALCLTIGLPIVIARWRADLKTAAERAHELRLPLDSLRGRLAAKLGQVDRDGKRLRALQDSAERVRQELDRIGAEGEETERRGEAEERARVVRLGQTGLLLMHWMIDAIHLFEVEYERRQARFRRRRLLGEAMRVCLRKLGLLPSSGLCGLPVVQRRKM